jgi:hypothetical protein
MEIAVGFRIIEWDQCIFTYRLDYQMTTYGLTQFWLLHDYWTRDAGDQCVPNRMVVV